MLERRIWLGLVLYVSIPGIGTPEPWEKHVQSCLGSGRNQHQYPEDIRTLQNQMGL